MMGDDVRAGLIRHLAGNDHRAAGAAEGKET
jgi:hypothetical protein